MSKYSLNIAIIYGETLREFNDKSEAEDYFISYTYELKVLNKKNNPFVWIYGIFKLQHLRKI